MSILAQNLKIIRKELKCTQSAMAEILKVGFRTFVRYEAGERDAPVSILVKIAKLGNLSLERLLTEKITGMDVTPVPLDIKFSNELEVKGCNFQSGQIIFSNPSVSGFISLDENEKRLLRIYRKMTPSAQNQSLDKVESLIKKTRFNSKALRTRIKKEVDNRKKSLPHVLNDDEAELKNFKIKRKGKPGRKKLDKKLLKEKINKLKLITQSINKITVK